jgi:hypothetical protein
VKPDELKDSVAVLLVTLDAYERGETPFANVMRAAARAKNSLRFCADCGGDGYYKGPRLGDEPCPRCKGDGRLADQPVATETPCPECAQRGDLYRRVDALAARVLAKAETRERHEDWLGITPGGVPVMVEPREIPAPIVCSRHHGYVPPGMVCTSCGQERCADCHMIGRHHSKCTKEVDK